jgi:hypothetical protein
VFSCHVLRFVLSFGELMSRGEKGRRIFRQLERLVRWQRNEFYSASSNVTLTCLSMVTVCGILIS